MAKFLAIAGVLGGLLGGCSSSSNADPTSDIPMYQAECAPRMFFGDAPAPDGGILTACGGYCCTVDDAGNQRDCARLDPNAICGN